MRKHYDFSKSQLNPYAKRLKKQITIRLDEDTIAYFKNLANEEISPIKISLICIFEIVLSPSAILSWHGNDR